MSAPPPVARLVVYVREGCHLCEDAMEVIGQVCDELFPGPALAPLEVELRDVDADPAVGALFGNDVPVVVLGDKIVFRHRIDANRLRALLQGQTTEMA